MHITKYFIGFFVVFFFFTFLDTFCSKGEWVLCVLTNCEFRGVVFSCKIGCLHTSTWRSIAYRRYLIAKRQRNFTGSIDVWSSKTALVHTCIGPCSVKKKKKYIEREVTRTTLRDFTSHPYRITWFTYTITTLMEDIRQELTVL